MFISSKEKIHIQNAIESLRFGLADATTEILYLKAKVKVLEGKPVKNVKTPEQKAKQAEYMRKYTARKRAEKKAQLAKAVA